ncbi:four-carbon acid sugar kinase family protein [Salinicola corii]|uniref:3-oxo-tetronate kinase n=1 Tax=Salinicola corii TaxID=2606937 RepID=A0A640WF68_9GAMM|nr:3-oxo-tetronate kinase [Salinicola corii]KAA0018803.1 four-carbon acid sugar kinase family protein [Salinicola corii]
MALIGCIADDFTGGTDLANNLVKSGFRTVQTIGVPDTAPEDVDAIVVALKSRSIPAADAVRQSLEALTWLQTQGCEKFYFKYCSTFDSTAKGNIGPVAEALMAALGCDATLFCPAFPATGRTVYHGYLFVGDVLLNESGMEHHPLNPMTDASLARWLDAQTRGRVGVLGADVIKRGEQATRRQLAALRDAGHTLIVTDTLRDAHLTTIALASRDMPLVTGGSGLALGLGALYSAPTSEVAALPEAGGGALILAGSASNRTREQIEHARQHMPIRALDPEALHRDFSATLDAIEQWAVPRLGSPLLIHSDTRPEIVRKAQQSLGVEASGALVERALAELATRLVEHDIGRLIVAGGETSGAIVRALGIGSQRIGPEIDPGVPWTWTESDFGPLHMALKSGNFGAPDMFTRAWEIIE